MFPVVPLVLPLDLSWHHYTFKSGGRRLGVQVVDHGIHFVDEMVKPGISFRIDGDHRRGQFSRFFIITVHCRDVGTIFSTHQNTGQNIDDQGDAIALVSPKGG